MGVAHHGIRGERVAQDALVAFRAPSYGVPRVWEVRACAKDVTVFHCHSATVLCCRRLQQTVAGRSWEP